MPDDAPTQPGSNHHVYRRLVHFAETDMAGILHFANTLRYVEEAEHSLFRTLGLTVHEHDPDGVWGWARKRIACDYLAPLRYQDRVDVRVAVSRLGRSSVDYAFRLTLGDGPGANPIATGSLTAVCIGRTGDGAMASRPIPPATRDSLLRWSHRDTPSRDGIDR